MCVFGGGVGCVFTSGECWTAGLIISTIKGKYLQLHPGQVLMKDSSETGLFHLSPACWSISTPPSAALLGFNFGEWVKQLALGLEVFPGIDSAEYTGEMELLKVFF